MSEKFKLIANVTGLAITLVIALVGAVGNYLNRGEEKAEKVLKLLEQQVNHNEKVQEALVEDVEKLKDALLMLGMRSLVRAREKPEAPEPARSASRRPSERRSAPRGLWATPLGGVGSGGGVSTPEVGLGPSLDEPEETKSVEPEPEEKKKVKKELKLDDMKSQQIVQQRPAMPTSLDAF